MKQELNLSFYLSKEDLFIAFKNQLRKDFENSGLNVDFTNTLPFGFEALKNCMVARLEPVLCNAQELGALIYRVDISERQFKKCRDENTETNFNEALAELIIRRVLQKVVLKKNFSM